MPWIIILILIALGIIFLLLELLVIPGSTFVGIIGLVALVLGVFQTFSIYGSTWGFIALIGTSLFSIAMLILSLRSKTWKKAMLSTSIESKIDHGVLNYNVGDKGVTISRLNPMGKAQIGDNFLEVTSNGNFIDQDCQIEIVEIINNKIFVDLLKE